MSGKKGRSGRQPKCIENKSIKNIEGIKTNVHSRLERYTRYLLGIDDKDLTSQQVQQLVTLHLKHAPEPKGNEGNALDILSRIAIEGAKEYARIKASRINDLHAEVIEVNDPSSIEDTHNEI